MKKYLILFALMLSAWTVNAQVAVKGVVRSSDDGQPMIGVSVFEKGTTNGVITDIDGNYSIKVKDENAVLVYNFIGFKAAEITVGKQGVINVTMDVDNELLDEVVVMGYSSKSKNEIASAVTVVSSEKLMDVTSPTIGDMLQGKVAGLSVVKESGAPGSEPTIRIRGVSSMSAPQSPLFVVDGIIGGDYDPNDVESLTVLKDAGATGLYGAQANGGVIVVTTKRAKSTTPVFNFKANVGVNVPDFSRQKFMNSSELRDYYREYYRNPETYLIDEMQFRAYFPESILENDVDWRDLVFKPALEQNYYFSMSGRTDRNTYYTAISYYDEDGTQLSSNYKHLNVRSNNTFNLTKWLTLTSNINVRANTSTEPESAAGFLVVSHVPFDNPYDENGEYASFVGRSDVYTRYPYNPMFMFDSRYAKAGSKGFGVNWDVILDFKITPWLSFTTQNRISGSTWKWHRHRTVTAESPWDEGDSIEENQSLGWGGITTNLFKASKDWGKHSVSGLAGVEAQMDWNESLSASAQGLPYGLFVLDVATTSFNLGGSNSRSGMQSFISQANYSFDSRFFVTAAFRVDQSSTFAKNNRTAAFPSASASWLMSNEKWLKDAAPSISNLKLKLSWGKTGMKDIGASKYLASYSYSGAYFGRTAAIPAQMANPELKWEQTTQTNLGVEFGLWDRLNFDINGYYNYTKDLLVNRDLAPSGGFTKQWQNYGALVNTGVEFAVNATLVKTKDFAWDADFSISYNKNTLTGFGDTEIYVTDSYDRGQIYKDGYSLYTWNLKEYAGVDPQTGRDTYYDANGNVTPDYSAARYSIELGNAIAPWQGGFSTSWQYKNFRLSTTGSFVWGNMVYCDRSRASDLQVLTQASIYPSNEDKIWRKPGDEATIGLPAYATANIVHSGFLKRGNYLKIRNVTLSYTLPKSIMKKNSLTLSASCNNVLTLSTLWGADPEASSRRTVAGCIDRDSLRYPNQRGYVFQANFTF